MVVYCPEYTRSSRLSHKYLVSINNLCQRDYGKHFFGNNVNCLDLDKYEIDHTANQDTTMDAAVGIADFHNNHKSDSRHLLVELRFGYESANNLDIAAMKRKVAHSRNILSPERVAPQAVFLFKPNVAPQAENRLFRLSRSDRELTSWKMMDIEGFSNYVIDRATLPYEPENNLDEIREELGSKYAKGEIHAIASIVEYWIDRIAKYNLRYKHAESSAIAKVLVDFLNSICIEDSSEEGEYLKLLIDEINISVFE